MLVFWAFGVEVIRLLSSEKYTEVAWLLPLMALAGGLFNFAQNYANRYMLALKTSKLVVPKVAASIAGITLNFFGTLYYGLPGLVVSVVITQALYVLLVVTVWLLTKRT